MMDRTPALQSELERNAFLTLFPDPLRRDLLATAQITHYPANTRLFREGDPAECLYLVLQGKVRLTKKDPSGKEQFLAMVLPGDYFGEFGVLDGRPRSAGATVAESDTVLARLPREAVAAAFHNSTGESVMKLALHTISKVRETNQLYVEERLRKERMTLIGEMANRIIHDLKSPFCVIQLVADMLRKCRNMSATDLCDLLETQLQRMQSMIEEILDFSRGQPQIKFADVSLQSLVSNIEKYNRYYFAQMHITWKADAPEVTLRGDPDKLLRAFQNIITNAIESFAGKEGEIAFRATVEGNVLTIAISDNGPGIAPELHGVLFEPFATLGKSKGTGLGMAVAKSIIEAHGGTITFSSAPARGTTFFIRLPLTAESLATHS